MTKVTNCNKGSSQIFSDHKVHKIAAGATIWLVSILLLRSDHNSGDSRQTRSVRRVHDIHSVVYDMDADVKQVSDPGLSEQTFTQGFEDGIHEDSLSEYYGNESDEDEEFEMEEEESEDNEGEEEFEMEEEESEDDEGEEDEESEEEEESFEDQGKGSDQDRFASEGDASTETS